MYLQKGISIKSQKTNFFCCWYFEGQWRKEQDPEPEPHPDPLVKGTDPDPLVKGTDPDPLPGPYQNVTDPEHWWIRIRSKTLLIRWLCFFLIGFCSLTLVLTDEGVAVCHPAGGSWHHAAAQHFPLQLLLWTEHPHLPVQAARRTLPPTIPG